VLVEDVAIPRRSSSYTLPEVTSPAILPVKYPRSDPEFRQYQVDGWMNLSRCCKLQHTHMSLFYQHV